MTTNDPTWLDEAVEPAARAMCVASGGEPDDVFGYPGEPAWTVWEDEARAAILAALPAINEGHAKVIDDDVSLFADLERLIGDSPNPSTAADGSQDLVVKRIRNFGSGVTR